MKIRLVRFLQALDPNRHRVAFQFAVGGLGFLLLVSLLSFTLLVHKALSAQTVHRAAIVVVFESGNTHKQCIEFTGDQISGLDLLERTGLDISIDASNGIGVAVCKIRRNGCDFPNQNCFCKCQGADCVYWSYWNGSGGGNWTYSGMGTSNRALHDGDIDGWVWGPGSPSSASPPPAVSFEQVCGAQATATPTETATVPLPTETPTETTAPTATRTATNVPPTATFTRTLTRTPKASSTRVTRTPTETRTATFTRTPTETRTPTLAGGATATRVAPTRRIQQNSAPPPTLPPEPTPEFVPTPFMEETLPPPQRSTRTRPPRTPTRIAMAQNKSADATRAAEESQIAGQAQGVDRHLLSGLVLVGGLVIGGAGVLVLLAGTGWYLMRRR